MWFGRRKRHSGLNPTYDARFAQNCFPGTLIDRPPICGAEPMCLGTWYFCPEFPFDLAPYVQRDVGAAASRKIRGFVANRVFSRPEPHVDRLATVLMRDDPAGRRNRWPG